MRWIAFILVAFALVCFTGPRVSRAGAAEDELAKMKGTWKVVEENIQGDDNTKDAQRGSTMTIDGDKLTFLGKDGKPAGPTEGKPITISDIDAAASPAKFTLHLTRGHGGKDETGEFHGIYKLDGDKLEIAIPDEPTQPRPDKLGAGKHTVYWRCERQK